MMETKPLGTAEGQDVPTVRQQSVFVENRVGQLLRLTRLFDQTDVRILAISVVYSVDCAICRMILDDPDRSYEVLTNADFQLSETELIVVSLPHGKRALLETWAALLGGEINIYYTYPLLVRPKNAAAIAVAVDNIEQSVAVLREHGFDLLDEHDLLDARND
ncbi:MAG: acetolactate synthase [Planctomycetes bacterium]|nr:acetolactate synthase [Planctomycetota bacterium]